jgi:cob(I)alamin adenosyltransferase
MRITKVYTRTGDKGMTRLAGGQKIAKDHIRIESYGTIDELNAVLGLARAFIQDRIDSIPQMKKIDAELYLAQNHLFDIGGILATLPGQTFPNMPEIRPEDVRRLEKTMDVCNRDLPALKEFILPGGGKIPAFLHQARTVCRRAERLCVRLNREEKIPPSVLKYLNRLGDALFVLARWAGWAQKETETYWRRTVRSP